MGLTCSLLGHEYGEPETEREREERGDEVVEYVRTVEYCERCGRERIVSESTEVRSVRQAPPSVAGDADDAAGERGSENRSRDEDGGLAAAFERVENEATTNSEPARVSEPAEFVDAAANAVAGTSTADETGSTGGDERDAGADEYDAPADDDAELITDDGDSDESAGAATAAETETGEGDDTAASATPDETAEDAGAWPTTDDDDATDEVDEPPTDDAVILTDDGTEQERERERERGAWPSSDDTRETERTTKAAATAAAEGESDDAEHAARAGIASAGPIEATPDREGGGELVCPECGKRTSTTGSSLRAGDICPDCHRGYLAESPESA
ncbi:hypothetical protein J2752_001928 [Halarchaeum rubridurum]|uniref:Uncharacterized protein n=1 Tax=Halarchaeum rubridurum TaxID=489911 RepID=A0A830G0V3_9EURY|nr:hypothetical protein [Halarchaeum rubridurum]MBP1955016.1 hypothetical protein [Halarchaeum rubridurum]GGM69681.1 hypothetical protein GCM10009017_19760 [Halarchaeum rubridurum]